MKTDSRRAHLPLLGLLVSMLFILNACKEQSTEADSPITYDYSYVNHYRNNFDASKFTVIKEFKYTRILMAPNTLTDDDVAKTATNIDTVITRICTYFNTSIGKEYNGFRGKVSCFIEPGIIPRCYGGSSIPIVSISTDNQLSSMYAHETVHIFSMNTTSTWLIEGLAVHVADIVGVERLWPNYADPLHVHANHFIDNIFYQTALSYIGMTGFYGVDPTTSTGEAFYTLSGSFVRYLMEKIPQADFMQCYSSADFKSTLNTKTNKSFDDWEKEWLSYLRAL